MCCGDNDSCSMDNNKAETKSNFGLLMLAATALVIGVVYCVKTFA